MERFLWAGTPIKKIGEPPNQRCRSHSLTLLRKITFDEELCHVLQRSCVDGHHLPSRRPNNGINAVDRLEEMLVHDFAGSYCDRSIR